MSEKGGKGYSLSSKAGSLKGKDDGGVTATKSSKGRRVQFSNSKEGQFESRISNSPKSGGKGDFSKGGKGNKAANGDKASASKGSLDPRIDQKLPENITCIMDCEAADMLQGIQDQMVMLSRDSSIKIPVPFDKGLQYAKSNNKYSNPESVRRVLDPLKDHGLFDNEICVIANACPETVDELFALLPSLKEKRKTNTQVLSDSLSELAKLKRFM